MSLKLGYVATSTASSFTEEISIKGGDRNPINFGAGASAPLLSVYPIGSETALANSTATLTNFGTTGTYLLTVTVSDADALTAGNYVVRYTQGQYGSPAISVVGETLAEFTVNASGLDEVNVPDEQCADGVLLRRLLSGEYPFAVAVGSPGNVPSYCIKTITISGVVYPVYTDGINYYFKDVGGSWYFGPDIGNPATALAYNGTLLGNWTSLPSPPGGDAGTLYAVPLSTDAAAALAAAKVLCGTNSTPVPNDATTGAVAAVDVGGGRLATSAQAVAIIAAIAALPAGGLTTQQAQWLYFIAARWCGASGKVTLVPPSGGNNGSLVAYAIDGVTPLFTLPVSIVNGEQILGPAA